MLERLKGARPDKTEAETQAEDRKRNEAKDGMPRFEPQPGGFGRRATPVANPAANTDTPKPAARAPQMEIEVGASLQFRKADPRPALESAGTSRAAGGSWSAANLPSAPTQGGQGLGDTPTRIAD